MTIRDSDTLKSYFNLANVLVPSNYVDLIDTIFAQGAGGIGGEHDHDNRYVQLSIANSISAIHLFSPSVYSPPFTLASNAQGQTVIGLKADQLDKSISVSGLGLSGGGLLTANQTITLTSSSNPYNTPSILASDSNGYLSLLRLNVDLLSDRSGSNLTIAPTGNISLDPGGTYVSPATNYETNLGSINKKYLTLHAAELWVETLVAQNTIATIGGRILVGPTTTLTSDLIGSQTNLVLNESFETAGAGGADIFADWIETASDGVVAQDAIHLYGLYSCRLTSGPSVNTKVEQYFTVVPGQGYTFAFVNRGDGGSYSGRYGVWDSTHSNWILSPIDTYNNSTTWLGNRFVITAPVGCTSMGIVLLSPNNNGSSAYFDGVVMYCDSIQVKHNEMAPNDVGYMEANGFFEGFLIISGPSGADPGPYTYWVCRNLDWSGLNIWYAGDALFNTGTTGEGFIDIYSIHGVKEDTDYGPTIVGNVRTGLALRDWTESWAIGNLNGLYGYGSNTYGAAFGKYADGNPFISVDADYGLRIRYRWGGVNYVKAQWDMSGNIMVGEVGGNNVYVNSGNLSIRNNTIERINLSAAGVLTIKNGAGNSVFTFDSSSGAEFTLPLTLASTGGIYQGNGTFASPATGLKIWNDSGIGRIAGYTSGNNDPQWYAGTDGKLYAGGGAVLMDANGINVAVSTSYADNRAYTVSAPAGLLGGLYGMYNSGLPAYWLFLQAKPIASYDSHLVLQSVAASGRSADIMLSTYNLASYVSINLDSSGIGSVSLSGNTIDITGALTIARDPISNANYLKFYHSAQTNGDDGVIAPAKYDEGLNIVGIQSVGGNGRKITIWGDVVGISGLGAYNMTLTSNAMIGGYAQTGDYRAAVVAYHNANQSISTGVLTFLSFNSEYYDYGNCHDVSSNNGRLYAPVWGIYLVIANVRWNGATGATLGGQRQINITSNAARAVIAAQHEHGVTVISGNTIPTNLSVSCINRMSANDYVECAVYQDSGQSIDITYSQYWSPNFSLIRLA